jgi:flagellin
MGLRISTNSVSISARRHLEKAHRQAEHSLQALASGRRIVRAGDDAAGFAIGELLRGQGKGLNQAMRNGNNAISMIQTAEGGLNEQNNILIRLRELAVQSASDTVSDTERGFLEKEFTQLTQEFDRIAQATEYGSAKLLTGEGKELEFHIGAHAGAENRIQYKMDADTRGSVMGVQSLSVAEEDDALDSLEDIDKAIGKLAGIRAGFGAMQSRLLHAVDNLSVQYENISEAQSRITDVDVAEESAKLVQAQIMQDMGVSVLAQASQRPKSVLALLN